MTIDLTPGAELPAFTRRTGFAHWNRYAAVNEEFVPIHMDDEAGRAAGFPGAIGMGNLAWSYVHNMLRGWLGTGGRIDRVSAQYQQPNIRDSTITAHGRIASVTPGVGGAKVVIDLWVDDDADRKLVSGQATVTVSRP
ncbi:MaoC/PaaZ C-terminal domain-containing protein [Phenylobacterium sp.]|uniref:MaoC/PaaZ C-terminal domain-containing protein n=1 Tax=Phenylobacterium sp. TaxID=1871053 RepID=UPI002F3F11D9